jgi:alkanesulfonate monooxygenase SsuD/methylene tetrahydromethanopterin reductase-like flavin-dependent oxidoreductase (luciferase family)
MQPPVDDMEGLWDGSEKYAVQQMLRYSFIGSQKTVQEEMQAFLDETQVDEIMVSAGIYDPAARLRSYELLTALCKAA